MAKSTETATDVTPATVETQTVVAPESTVKAGEAEPQVGTGTATFEAVELTRGDEKRTATSLAQKYALEFDGFRAAKK